MAAKFCRRSPLSFVFIQLFLWTLGYLFLPIRSHLQAADAESVCAEVKIEINQELALERQAFDAHLSIQNGLSHITLEDVAINVFFTDEQGNFVIADTDPDNTEALFFIRVDSIENVDDIQGTGTIAPATTADIHWLIIPASGAANGLESGALYYVGATLSYTIGGDSHVTRVSPDYIYVKPLPELALDYFIPTDVYGDDAFTPEIEPPVPFSFGIRVKNNGSGITKDLRIGSAQPKIIDNSQGLQIGFVIEKSEINGSPGLNRLQVPLGDIAPNASATARWIMHCTLSGQFDDFIAEFSHSDELGGELTSLITAANTHHLVRDVLVDLPERDRVRDFLSTDGLSYRVFESDSLETAVIDQTHASSLQFINQDGSESRYGLNFPATDGFVFVKLADPFGGQKNIKEALRTDGKIIKPDNAWLSKRRDGSSWRYYFNLFDVNTSGDYTISFEDAAIARTPVLQFIPDRIAVEQQQLSFLVTAGNPDGPFPVLTATPLPAGAVFFDPADGTAVFSWTPAAGQAGAYTITFIATDGTLTASQRAVITVFPANDTDGDGMADDWEITHFGSLDRDGAGDFDGDGITDLNEFLYGTDPAQSDHAPTVPEIVSPADGDKVDTLTPALVISNSTDVDGDPVTYEIEIFSDSHLSMYVTGDAGISQGTETTSWTVPEDLTENREYTWRVRATDGAAYSLWAYGRFFVNTVNDPPGTFAVSHPLDGTTVDNQTPTLTVTNSRDPDGDTLTYGFEVYADSDMSSQVASVADVPEGTGGATSWTTDAWLADQKTYYWRAIATDEHGIRTETPAVAFSVDTANTAPTPPAISFPISESQVDATTLDLVVENATDAEGDPLIYLFEIDTVDTFDSPARQTSGEISENTDTTAWQVSGLEENRHYYWRVKATDGASESSWRVGTFFINTENDAPSVPTLRNPGEAAWVGVIDPVLAVNPALDPDDDDLTYRFGIYSDKHLSDPVSEGVSIFRDWVVPVPLENNTWYYWSVQAEDPQGLTGEWMPSGKFFVRQDGSVGPPDNLTVEVSTGDSGVLINQKVYAFTESGAYTGAYALTDDAGRAVFDPADFQDGPYRFRTDYLGEQFWSATISFPQVFNTHIRIDIETVEVTVTTASGPAQGVKVYLFSETGAYLGIFKTTDADGKIALTLPVGKRFKFRADILGNQYWSAVAEISADGTNAVAVATEGGVFTVVLQEDAQTPMPGIKTYLFNTAGAYLGRYHISDASGAVGFQVPEGVYRVRADYLGYRFWSPETLVDEDTAIDLTLAHQDIDITVAGAFQGVDSPMAGIKVYLFTPSGSYLGQYRLTDQTGVASFHLPQMSYTVRADYLNQQSWSSDFTWEDIGISIPMADAEIAVTQNSLPIEGVAVYVFSTTGAYLGVSGPTDSNGIATFRLPAADYTFRADYQGSQYWSEEETLIADLSNPVPITTGGGSFDLTVRKGVGDPLSGVKCYVFDTGNTYLGLSGTTDSNGKLRFDLSDGGYKIRADHLGYRFWSGPHEVASPFSTQFEIPHRDTTITVVSDYPETRFMEGLKVYLFMPSKTYLGHYQITDGAGAVRFSLPDQNYKVRIDYLGQQLWSRDFKFEDIVVDIQEGVARVRVNNNGQSLQGVPVYLFSSEGTYLAYSETTDADGVAVFRLPAGNYSFRADYQGSRFSADAAITYQSDVPVDLNTGGGEFILTLDTGQGWLANTRVYVFNTHNSYLGMSAVSDADGQVRFSLSRGTYRFRIDHLGYQFFSTDYTLPAQTSGTFLISHDPITITVQGQKDISRFDPLTGLKVYLFSEADTYLGKLAVTDENGMVQFFLPAEKTYMVRVDFLGQQFWSDPIAGHDTDVTIPMAEADVFIGQGNDPLEGVKVYLFSENNTYLGIPKTTDADGLAVFNVPAASYMFRADFQGSRYFSDPVSLSPYVENSIPIDTGGGRFTLTVLKGENQPLEGAKCYVFSDGGAYLGMSATTDVDGRVSFDLSEGSYKFRIDHRGYQFFTDIFNPSETLNETWLIDHQDIRITVESLYQNPAPLSGIKVYLFTPAHAYLGQYEVTDENGRVFFSLPDKEYDVRADYLGKQYWSGPFQSEDQTITIDHGLAEIHAVRGAANAAGAKVYLFSETGSYLNRYEITDTDGLARFLIPAETFKFRVDEGGSQGWSDIVSIPAGSDISVEVSLD